MTYKEIIHKKDFFQGITWKHLSNCLKSFENRELMSVSIWAAGLRRCRCLRRIAKRS